jgi:hypothetical protein
MRRRLVLFILKELPMLRARPLGAAPAAVPAPAPRPATSIYETSHQIRENSHSPLASHSPALTPHPCFLPRPCFRAPVLLVLLLAHPTPAHAQALSAACPVNGYTAAATQATGGQNLVCSSLTWHYVPYQFGASAGTCPGASNVNLGIIQWTGAAFQGCTASGWGSLASGGGTTALSALVAATATNSINNVNFAQTWTWGTLGSNTALTLSSTGMTTGTLLALSNTSTPANSGYVLNVSNSEGGNSFGIYSSMLSATNTGAAGYFSNATTNVGYAVVGIMTAHGNTGKAGYFVNTDTSSTTTNYGVYGLVSTATSTTSSNSAGVYGEGDCNSCAGVAGVSAYNAGVSGTGDPGVYGSSAGYAIWGNNYGTGNGAAVYGITTGHGNTGYAGYFTNTDTSSGSNVGVYGITLSTGGQSSGVYGECDSVNCAGTVGISNGGDGVYGSAGLAGVFGNAGGATSIGVEGQQAIHGNTGYAGYFINTDTSSSTNYAVYALAAGSNAFGVWSSGVATGVYGQGSGAGVYGYTWNTGVGSGVFGVAGGTGNTGYGGWFSNTSTGVVNYGLYASTSSATGWAGYFQGNIYVNGTITMSSDRSLKQDIEPLDTEDALDEIIALRPVAFTWKKTGVSDMGLIAQEVDLVYPDLVTRGGANETLALKYTSLIAPMIASIQELKKRDDELEIENASLRREFDTYKASHP